MQFKDPVTFIKSFLKDPKKIISVAMISGSILVGSQKISAQSLQFIKPIELNPTIYKEGHVFSSKTYSFSADSSTNLFLEQAFEYRFGEKFKKENQYNFAIEVGRNNLYFNGKLVPDLTFARIYSTLYLSNILKTPIDIRLGYSKEISNFVLKDIKPLDKTSLQASLSTDRLGGGVSLKVDQGKIKSFDGIFDLKFENKYSAGLRYTENISSSRLVSIQGFAQMKEGNLLFMPMAQVGLEFTKTGKKIPFVNYALYYVPNKKLEIFLHRNVSHQEKSGFYVELNYLLGKKKEKKILDLKEKKVKVIIKKEEKVKEKPLAIENIEKSRDNLQKSKKNSFLKELFKRDQRVRTIKNPKGYPMVKKPKRPR